MVLVFDTDPGVDDMLALLLLLGTPKAQAELRMITLTYGNCTLMNTLNNTLSLFSVIEKENAWRAANALPPFCTQRPEVYLGASRALTGEELPEAQELAAFEAENNSVDATDVHGSDGLAGIHASNPEFDAPEDWFKYFQRGASPETLGSEVESLPFKPGYTKPAWQAILDLLKSEPAKTVTIMAVGPLTNLAKAAAIDPETFSRVKEVLSMGAALRHPGNVTPLAEFNVFTDPLAAAQIYALTSNRPQTTMPCRTPPKLFSYQPSTPLNLVIFALDITQQHVLMKADVDEEIGGVLRKYPQSVLAQWINVWLVASFANYGRLVGLGPENAKCHLHDPLTAAYALEQNRSAWTVDNEDVRVETEGQWSAGHTVVDDRGRARQEKMTHDLQKWLTIGEGNDVQVVKDTPIKTSFAKDLLKKITGLKR